MLTIKKISIILMVFDLNSFQMSTSSNHQIIKLFIKYAHIYIFIINFIFNHLIFRIRLKEGFKFAHSSAGIINMVLQVDMIEVSIYFY